MAMHAPSTRSSVRSTKGGSFTAFGCYHNADGERWVRLEVWERSLRVSLIPFWKTHTPSTSRQQNPILMTSAEDNPA